MSLMLGDDGRQRGQFGDLVPTRFGIARCGSLGQRGLASGAGRRHVGDDLLHPVGWEPKAMRSGMSRLPARLAPALGLDDRLGSPRWIGRRRRGGVGGVAVELAAEFVELGLQEGDLLLSHFQGGAELSAFRTGRPGSGGQIAHTLTIRPAATIA